MASAARVLDALGDPTRREIVSMLSSAPSSVQQLADRLPISRPAVSQHLRVLTDADVVGVEPAGTRRIYHLDVAGIEAARSYLDEMWDVALRRFALLAENTGAKAPATVRKGK